MRHTVDPSTGIRHMKVVRVLRSIELLLIAFALGLTLHAQSSCKTVFDADDRKDATPYHAYVTRTMQIRGSKSESSEAIFVGGVAYIQVKGTWKRSLHTAEQQRKQKLEDRQNSHNVACKYLRDETVNGEMAHVFAVHTENDVAKSNATIWVSMSRGLLIRNEQDIDVGGAGGTSHVSTRYEYSNIVPPAVRP